MILAVIAAIAKNNVIGRNGKLPWHLPDDLRRFQCRTLHHAVLMGRVTYESLGTPLPKRRTIVITSKSIPGVETYPSLTSALQVLRTEERIFVIGGAQLYKEAIPIADELYLTYLPIEVEGDTYFPYDRTYIDTSFRVVNVETTSEAEYVFYVRKQSM